jgi:hypothetical protein
VSIIACSGGQQAGSTPGGSDGSPSPGPGSPGSSGSTFDGSSADAPPADSPSQGPSGAPDGSDTGVSSTPVIDSGGATLPAASGPDGGAACPSLTGPADNAYPRWPMPNPAAANLPNPFHYTDLGNGTVRDDVTQLVWQKTVDATAQAFAWAAASTYCSSLTLPAPQGSTWRVPTRIEALSLVDYTTQAAMDAPFLGSGQPPGGKYTWTSTPWVVSQIATKPQDAWMVNFGGGGGLTSNAASQAAVEYVRCVASPPSTALPYPHYAQVAPREVKDVLTGLVWDQTSSLTLVSQSAATAYCAGLGLDGHTWRLPSVNELSSLVDDNPPIARVSPAIDTCVFPDTPANGYYMSSSSVGTKTWALNYQDGYDSNSQSTGYVRCVR